MGKAFISRVKIKNYRNFLNVDFSTCEKQLVLGENTVGKSNYIRALRLILDQSFSDFDRVLTEADFNSSLVEPMKNGVSIEISIYISDYESNSALMSVLGDAKVIENGVEAVKITYVFEPRDKDDFSKGLLSAATISAVTDWDDFFVRYGIFIGKNTLETDILESFFSTSKQVIIDSVLEVTTGGNTHKQNFKDNYKASKFQDCYRVIESKYVGKANFVQELSSATFGIDSIPKYIDLAIKFISR